MTRALPTTRARRPIRYRITGVIVPVLLLATAFVSSGILPSAAAQQDGPISTPSGMPCSDASRAIPWWADRQDAASAAGGATQAFWESVRPALELQLVSDGETRAACDFLAAMLSAQEALLEGRLDDSGLSLRAASQANTGLIQARGILARQAVVEHAALLGGNLEGVVRSTQVTTQRVHQLEALRDLYADLALDGAEARVQLWLQAEQRSWELDRHRVDLDLSRATLVIDALGPDPGLPALVASIPGLRSDLAVDATLMDSHGDEERAEAARAMSARLVGTQLAGLRYLLGGAFALSLVAVLLVVVLRFPVRAIERDLHDVTIAHLGVPR